MKIHTVYFDIPESFRETLVISCWSQDVENLQEGDYLRTIEDQLVRVLTVCQDPNPEKIQICICNVNYTETECVRIIEACAELDIEVGHRIADRVLVALVEKQFPRVAEVFQSLPKYYS